VTGVTIMARTCMGWSVGLMLVTFLDMRPAVLHLQSLRTDPIRNWRTADDQYCSEELLKVRNPQMYQIESSAFHESRRIKMNSATAVKDPVCGMEVEAATAAGQSEKNGQKYYFCSTHCKERFDLNPLQYLGKSAAAPKSGEGCCG
jgi:YHS domain-containing protein